MPVLLLVSQEHHALGCGVLMGGILRVCSFTPFHISNADLKYLNNIKNKLILFYKMVIIEDKNDFSKKFYNKLRVVREDVTKT